MTKESLKAVGKWTTVATYDDGHTEVRTYKNMIVNVGFDFLIQCMTGVGGRPNVLSHIAVGSSTTPSTGTMTALVSETERQEGTITFNPGSKTFRITAVFPKGAIMETITEQGVFNAASGGTMLNRLLMDPPQPGGANVQFTTYCDFEVL